jgi:hypothetical protein
MTYYQLSGLRKAEFTLPHTPELQPSHGLERPRSPHRGASSIVSVHKGTYFSVVVMTCVTIGTNV